MSGNSNRLIAFPYLGAKNTVIDEIKQYFPSHIHFVDVFFGSGAVTLNKQPSSIETANDINGDVVNFFRMLREQPSRLIAALELTPVSREEFDNSWDMTNITDLERARRFFVRARQSFRSMGEQAQNKGWNMAKTKSETKHAETVTRWINSIDMLPLVIERLKQIQFENRHFRDLIPAVDFSDAFFYLDPTYVPESRKSKNDYRFEMTIDEHYELAEIAHNIEGKAMISGYKCKLMKELYGDWHFRKLKVRANNMRRGRVQECIWMNYTPPTHSQSSIFDLINQATNI